MGAVAVQTELEIASMTRTAAALAIATVLTAVAASGAAQAQKSVNIQANNAAELADLCAANPREPGADAKINFCHGYAQGALDATRRRAQEAKKFCFPPNPPPRPVVIGEFVNWVRALPEHRSQPAVDGLLNFFSERFPCK